MQCAHPCTPSSLADVSVHSFLQCPLTTARAQKFSVSQPTFFLAYWIWFTGIWISLGMNAIKLLFFFLSHFN